MGTISYLFGLLCFIALLGHRCFDSDLLDDKITNKIITNQAITNNQNGNHQTFSNQINKSPDYQINHLLNVAISQIGVRESTGNNDGREVEKYLAYTGNHKGEAWCAAFVSWVFGRAGYAAPRTGWSPALFPKAKLVYIPEPGSVFGIYFVTKKRIAHTGLVERKKNSWIYTIEGNTNVIGSREGDGVYRRLRHAKTIAVYANWLSLKKGGVR